MKKQRWSQKELDLLIEHYPDRSTKEVADMLGRKERSVYNKANSLGIKKSNKYLDECYRRQSEMKKGQVFPGQFKKGHKPWNEGMKGLQIGGVETQFRTGNKPHNTKKGGALSWRKEYWYRKISDGNWVLEHRRLWEEVHGEIPPKHVVRFIDNNPHNITIENLECIPMAENQRRNSRHRYPESVRELITAKATLTRTINNYGKRKN